MKLALSMAALLAMTAGPAIAQPGRPEYIMRFATNEAVQKDLGVSDDVARKLRLLHDVDYRAAELKAYQDAGYQSPIEPTQMAGAERQKFRAIAQKVNDDFLPKLEELLTAEQYQRFQQIRFRNRLIFNGPRTLLASQVASELKLTDIQKLQLYDLGSEFGRSGPFLPVFGGKGGGPGGFLTFDNTYKHGVEYRTKAIELLTPDQEETLKKLEGKEFDLSALVGRSTPPPPIAGLAIGTQQSQVTRQPTDTLNLAAMEAVQKDLGVSDEVASRLTRLLDEYRAALLKEYQDANLGPRSDPNALTPDQRQRQIEIQRRLQGQFAAKAEAHLSDDQRRRIQQISFQRRWNSNAPLALLLADSDLKVTAEQRQTLGNLVREFPQATPLGGTSEALERIAKHRQESIERAVDVLTAEQKETLSNLKGKEFDLSKLVLPGARQGKGN
jgi:hypothetical protein